MFLVGEILLDNSLRIGSTPFRVVRRGDWFYPFSTAPIAIRGTHGYSWFDPFRIIMKKIVEVR